MTNTTDATDADHARTATLRRIGRNLVNVQRIELMMKFLLQMNFSVPLREVEVHFKEHVERISRGTLGSLIRDLSNNVLLASDSAASMTAAKEVWISTSVSFPLDAEALAAWNQEWEMLRTKGIAFLSPIVTATRAHVADMASGEMHFDPPLPDRPQD